MTEERITELAYECKSFEHALRLALAEHGWEYDAPRNIWVGAEGMMSGELVQYLGYPDARRLSIDPAGRVIRDAVAIWDAVWAQERQQHEKAKGQAMHKEIRGVTVSYLSCKDIRTLRRKGMAASVVFHPEFLAYIGVGRAEFSLGDVWPNGSDDIAVELRDAIGYRDPQDPLGAWEAMALRDWLVGEGRGRRVVHIRRNGLLYYPGAENVPVFTTPRGAGRCAG